MEDEIEINPVSITCHSIYNQNNWCDHKMCYVDKQNVQISKFNKKVLKMLLLHLGVTYIFFY